MPSPSESTALGGAAPPLALRRAEVIVIVTAAAFGMICGGLMAATPTIALQRPAVLTRATTMTTAVPATLQRTELPGPTAPRLPPRAAVPFTADAVQTSHLPQASSAWTAMAAFLAGCAVAVAGIAVKLRPAPKSLAAQTIEDPFAMLATTAHQDVAVPPPVLGKNPDENSLHRKFEAMLRRGQDKVCAAIEACDGVGKFRADAWVREGGGGGISRVLSGGKVWEKAGVNLSVIYGTMPAETVAAARERQAAYAKDTKPGERIPFFACGLSCVMHPRNPHCPTMHFNYRYFETEAGDWWFAGGTDITPVYLDEEDMKHFHGTYKQVCDKHDPTFYQKFKKWADEYFMIAHRGETRGLGGIFYDDLNDRDPWKIFAFSEECLDNVVTAYVPIIEKHKNDTFTEEQKRWQLIRRGRYAEFNLIYDRGTIFGLKTGIGRMESIMMTLPEVARWEYNHHPAPGSEEEKIMKLFKNPRDWV